MSQLVRSVLCVGMLLLMAWGVSRNDALSAGVSAGLAAFWLWRIADTAGSPLLKPSERGKK